MARYPNGNARHLMHRGLIKSLRCIVEEAGVPKDAIVEEARGLRKSNASRPDDLLVLDFTAPGRHIIMDGQITTI